jgi:hypothetical protein
MVLTSPFDHEDENQAILFRRESWRGEVVEHAVDVDLAFGCGPSVIANGRKAEMHSCPL